VAGLNHLSMDLNMPKLDANFLIDGFAPFRKKWMLIVLMEFKDKPTLSFQYLQDKFSISPSVLSSTLKELVNHKLVSRKVFGDTLPIKVEYKVSYYGKRIIDSFHGLMEIFRESKIK